ncbi:orotidine-5'-phosphate decarboxylase [Methanonatronarchaeum sp. AMET6-2]|uniref:orotidine-5'-phosphate decarboxylase n=1 Tax=Methanonatronarchaeum sp. AMET6-2 TaxID=2933293 RepID=UPI00122A97F5|nr:orotidine-5'-phosphate decarboxylase [Methanonatronarchaeum sp. AMET6-2]RZN62248.1 MAG: orotidine-5'-phosphate decarboxylase [Methanonatronarchaeia archaeon]UOY10416.1 orotidine-5'-phosphate decarboxylase [Methanonatronarchaeum sp. AMET6-2]
MQQNTGLIFAADLEDGERAVNITNEISDLIDAVKVNYPIILSNGLDIVEELSRTKEVIADLKIADVPHINRKICRNVFEAGASAVICHGFTGRNSMEACSEMARQMYGEVYVVAEMSHPDAERFIHQASKEICRLANMIDADGLIAPANDPERLKRVRDLSGGLKILSPGVGVQGGGASTAIQAGADQVIVGRSIYDHREPRQAAMEIVQDIGYTNP